MRDAKRRRIWSTFARCVQKVYATRCMIFFVYLRNRCEIFVHPSMEGNYFHKLCGALLYTRCILWNLLYEGRTCIGRCNFMFIIFFNMKIRGVSWLRLLKATFCWTVFILLKGFIKVGLRDVDFRLISNDFSRLKLEELECFTQKLLRCVHSIL